MYDYRRYTDEQKQAVLRERRLHGLPLHAPPHVTSDSGWYLITAAVFKHREVFTTNESRQDLLEQFQGEFGDRSIMCTSWVILPNHYHFLLHHDDRKCIREAVRLTHGRSSKQLNDKRGTRGTQNWCNYSDRAIRSERHYWTTLNYIHYNPVKHGYCDRISQWDCSSVHVYFEEKGLDWLNEVWREHPLRDYGNGWDW